MRGSRILILLLVAGIAPAVPAATTAAATYTDTVTGYEYYATSTDGRFAGTASGALPGTWNTEVQHTALCPSCPSTATITGGSFSLATIYHSLPTLFSGSLRGGTVRVTNPGPNCSKQTFAVEGILGNVHGWFTGTGSGTFTATLTHYRHSLFGTCVTYAASISGTLSIGI
jgi:hypothetical protein